MKTLVVYKSQTGFTKKYAQWIAERAEGKAIPVSEAKKLKKADLDQYDAIVYGGWCIAGQISGDAWLRKNYKDFTDKKLVLFACGASPEDYPDTQIFLQKTLNEEEKKYIKLFYCPGGLNYEKMNAGSKLAMKALVATIRANKKSTKEDLEAADIMSSNYDNTDEKHVEPIISYLYS